MRKNRFLTVIKSYAKHLQKATKVPVIISPSEVKSERFHISLSLLPHPVMVGNGRSRFRLRATVFAEIPPSDPAIDDCLEKSIALAKFFDQAEGFTIYPASPGHGAIHGMAYHTALGVDDELFADLEAVERSYSYNESWLVELEFSLEKI